MWHDHYRRASSQPVEDAEQVLVDSQEGLENYVQRHGIPKEQWPQFAHAIFKNTLRTALRKKGRRLEVPLTSASYESAVDSGVAPSRNVRVEALFDELVRLKLQLFNRAVKGKYERRAKDTRRALAHYFYDKLLVRLHMSSGLTFVKADQLIRRKLTKRGRFQTRSLPKTDSDGSIGNRYREINLAVMKMAEYRKLENMLHDLDHRP